jgi:tetratricopeptide (TPR) repeat protein
MASMGAYPESLASNRRALGLREEAARADPNDQRAATAVAASTKRIGTTLHSMGNLDEALAESQRAVALYEDVTRRSKEDWGLVLSLAEAHDDVADVLMDLAARRGIPAARQQEWRARALAEDREALALYEGQRDKGALPKAQEKRIAELKETVEKIRRAAQ